MEEFYLDWSSPSRGTGGDAELSLRGLPQRQRDAAQPGTEPDSVRQCHAQGEVCGEPVSLFVNYFLDVEFQCGDRLPVSLRALVGERAGLTLESF